MGCTYFPKQQPTAKDIFAAIQAKNINQVKELCRSLGAKRLNEAVDFEGMGKATVLDFARRKSEEATRGGPLCDAVFYRMAVRALEEHGAHSLAALSFAAHIDKEMNRPGEAFHLLQ